MRWSRTPILLLLSRCLTIRRAPQKEWLLYPAYPRHFFSLRGLVHICIPHTGTPCGRVIGNKVLLALVGTHLFVVALPSPFVPLLYHNLGDLSRGFLHFLRIFFREHLRPCYTHNGKHSSTATLSPWNILSIAHPLLDFKSE